MKRKYNSTRSWKFNKEMRRKKENYTNKNKIISKNENKSENLPIKII